ncbi:TetR/AcrR family transcriptional regulator [Nakamurella deserti]|uniref:TetR/AcrR family transcriptional regulator n=1 Tax=Nakamurella deserti TaxID=2164074 RepID=UPI000DBE88F3|nr:TetR/AcrR family transcriptional regulator [Nakamurella deserti]
MPDPSEVERRHDVAARIVRSTAALVNRHGIEGVSVPAICAAAGVGESAFADRFGSVNDVFVEIARFMTAAFGTAIDASMNSDHSLLESIRAAQHSFLDVVEEHVDIQNALMVIRSAAAVDPTVGVAAGSSSSLQAELVLNAELWLIETARLHDITWDLPRPLLAAFVSTSLTGVVIDYLARREMPESRRLVDMVAADLARHGAARTDRDG